jgi:hypothetical protein
MTQKYTFSIFRYDIMSLLSALHQDLKLLVPLFTEHTTHHTWTRPIRDRRQNKMFVYREKLQHSNRQLFNIFHENAIINVTVTLFYYIILLKILS